jgi:predicted DNA-binding ribbon-helix-helix protein
MCEYYVKADPIQYEQRSRTIRMKGVLTTIRIENSFWDILAEMAEQETCTTNALITKFHDEILADREDLPNFASFLRVTCIRYMRRNLTDLEKKIESSKNFQRGDQNLSIQPEIFSESTGTYGASSTLPVSNISIFKR